MLLDQSSENFLHDLGKSLPLLTPIIVVILCYRMPVQIMKVWYGNVTELTKKLIVYHSNILQVITHLTQNEWQINYSYQKVYKF